MWQHIKKKANGSNAGLSYKNNDFYILAEKTLPIYTTGNIIPHEEMNNINDH